MRQRFLLLVTFTSALVSGCADSTADPEPDTSEVYFERTEPLGGPLESSMAVAEVDGAAWAAVGSEIVRIASASVSDRIVAADRVHGSIVSDARFVYFATQSLRVGATWPVEDVPVRDSAIYRMARDGSGTPEKIVDVDILVGQFTLSSGHLYVCESGGLNSGGTLLDIEVETRLDDAPRVARSRFGMNEFCEGVVADDANVYLAMNASKKTRIYGGDDPKIVEYARTIEVARVSKAALTSGEPWPADEGPARFATTSLTPGVEGMYLVADGIVLRRPEQAIRVGLDGAQTESPTRPEATWAIPDGDGWLEATSGYQQNLKEDVCRGGRLYRRQGGAEQELTKAVCAPAAMTAGAALWFVETATLADPGVTNHRTRVRVKRLERR